MATDAKRWRDFLKTNLGAKHQTVHLFSESGEPLLKRHTCNKRKLGVQVGKYVKGILEHGILSELRGTLVMIAARNNTGPNSPQFLDIVGGGTLMESVYVAIETEPANEFCQLLKEEGVSNVLILKPDTPYPDLCWCKSVHNRFHDGMADTLAEKIRSAPLAQDLWKAEAERRCISVRTCPKTGPFTYEQQYKDFIAEHYGHLWPKWQHYDNTKAVFNCLKEIGMDEAFISEMESYVDMSDRELSAIWAVHHMHAFKTLIYNEMFTKVVEREVLDMIFVESLFLCCAFTNKLESHPWIFKQKKPMGETDWLKAPMGGSVIYSKASARKRAFAAAKQAAVKKKAKTGKFSATAIPEPEIECANLSDGTEKVWLHDLAQCLECAGKLLEQSGLKASIRPASIRKCVVLALRFCFQGEVAVHGKTIKAWKQLRSILKEDIVRDNVSLLSSVAGFDAKNASGAEICDAIIDVLNRDDDGVEATAMVFKPLYAMELQKYLNADNAKEAVSFFDNNGNLNLPPELCAGFQDACRLVVPDLQHNSDANHLISLHQIADVVLPKIYVALPEFLHQVAVIASKHMSIDSSKDIEALTGGYFASVQLVERVLQCRPAWLIEMLKSLVCGAHKVVDCDLTESWFQAINKLMDHVVLADAAANTFNDWQAYWLKLFRTSACKSSIEVAEALGQICDAVLAKPDNEPEKGKTGAAGANPPGANSAAAPTMPNTPVFTSLHQCRAKNLVQDGPIIKVFMQELQSFIERAAILGFYEEPSDKRKNVKLVFMPDKGDKHVGHIEGDDKTPVAKLPLQQNGINLVFRGAVSRIPVKGSLPVCSALGHEFFLSSVNQSNPYGADGHCLAWEVKDHKPATRPKPNDPVHVLECKVSSLDWSFTYRVGSKVHECTTSVTLYSLHQDPNFVAAEHETKAGYVVLSKAVISAQTKPPEKEKGSRKGKGKGKGGAGTLDLKWVACKHLLR